MSFVNEAPEEYEDHQTKQILSELQNSSVNYCYDVYNNCIGYWSWVFYNHDLTINCAQSFMRCLKSGDFCFDFIHIICLQTKLMRFNRVESTDRL